eukprot:4527202-Prymnesium_polylepis.1
MGEPPPQRRLAHRRPAAAPPRRAQPLRPRFDPHQHDPRPSCTPARRRRRLPAAPRRGRPQHLCSAAPGATSFSRSGPMFFLMAASDGLSASSPS